MSHRRLSIERSAEPKAGKALRGPAPQAGVCLHCGLDVPPHRADQDQPFCCEGCRRVYELIHTSGLERYYNLRTGETAPPPEERDGSFAWLDPLLQASRRGEAEGLRRLTLDVQGIHCAACVWLLRELFLRRAGAVDLRLNPTLGKAEFTWFDVEGGLDLESYLREADRFGYRFGPDRRSDRRHGSHSILRIGVCAAAAMNVMIFSFCYYAGLSREDGRIYTLFGELNLALTAFAVGVGGSVFLRSAAAALRRGVVHLDLPIALGILLSFAGSTAAHFTRGPEAAYFDTVAVFVTLMLVGRWLQERVLTANRNRILEQDGIDHLFVRRRRGGEIESIPAHHVERGDELWIAPGELIPVDGVALHRAGSVSLDWITGESEPVDIGPGDQVPAGAFNAGRAPLPIAAIQAFAESNLHALIGSTATPEGTDVHGVHRPSKFWHRFGTIYVASVLVLATAGFLAWVGRDPAKAMDVAVAVLVVTCPCALGLATPLARELAHVALRRRGVFVRNAGFLDRVLAVRTIVFDKTGTLTFGRLVPTGATVAALRSLPAEDRDALRLLTIGSNHPVSRALATVLHGGGAGALLPEGILSTETRELEGSGVEATIAGRAYRLGRGPFAAPACAGEASGGTVFSRDGKHIATFSFREEIRPDAAEEVRRLRAEGLSVHLLSGDTIARTVEVAAAVGIPESACAGGLDPWQKAARVRALGDGTWMIGDGLNDAPSFDAALCTATPAIDRPALPGKADLYFLGEGIVAVRRCLLAARRLRATIHANLGFALAYNAVALTLCFTGAITPLVAAILMPISSVTVVGNTALRLSGRRLAWMS